MDNTHVLDYLVLPVASTLPPFYAKTAGNDIVIRFYHPFQL